MARFLISRPLAILAAALLAAATASGQTPPPTVNTDVERSDMMGTITRQLIANNPDYVVPSPADDDLGVQRVLTRRSDYRPFTLFSSVNEFFTTNAALSNSNPQSDWFTSVLFGASYMPRINGGLFAEFTAVQQLFRYANYGGLNFNSLDLGAGLVYVFRDFEGLSIFARYNYNLLTPGSADSSLFYQQTVRAGVTKPFIFSRAHSATVGLAADINLDGWPEYALRNRFAFLAGYQLNITRILQANAFYQLAYFPYVELGRRDWNQIVSLALVLNLSQRFNISTSVSAAFNESNESFYEYSVLNAGVGIAANYTF
jgi:hypothetical protein